MKRILPFGLGYVAGFATLFVLMLIFGDYSDTPSQVSAAPSVPQIDAGLVLGSFQSTGIQVQDIDRTPQLDPNSPLPRSFRSHATWKDALLGDKGGQLFVCDSPDLCRSISAYFQALVGLAGPYTYTSPSGLVVVQVNSSYTPDQAIRYKNALANY